MSVNKARQVTLMLATLLCLTVVVKVSGSQTDSQAVASTNSSLASSLIPETVQNVLDSYLISNPGLEVLPQTYSPSTLGSGSISSKVKLDDGTLCQVFWGSEEPITAGCFSREQVDSGHAYIVTPSDTPEKVLVRGHSPFGMNKARISGTKGITIENGSYEAILPLEDIDVHWEGNGTERLSRLNLARFKHVEGLTAITGES